MLKNLMKYLDYLVFQKVNSTLLFLPELYSYQDNIIIMKTLIFRDKHVWGT